MYLAIPLLTLRRIKILREVLLFAMSVTLSQFVFWFAARQPVYVDGARIPRNLSFSNSGGLIPGRCCITPLDGILTP